MGFSVLNKKITSVNIKAQVNLAFFHYKKVALLDICKTA